MLHMSEYILKSHTFLFLLIWVAILDGRSWKEHLSTRFWFMDTSRGANNKEGVQSIFGSRNRPYYQPHPPPFFGEKGPQYVCAARNEKLKFTFFNYKKPRFIKNKGSLLGKYRIVELWRYCNRTKTLTVIFTNPIKLPFTRTKNRSHFGFRDFRFWKFVNNDLFL